jgi:hypothetical protein
VFLHEAAHAIAARANGIEVHGITLVFFGGFTAARADEKGPGPAFAIAALGPGTSVWDNAHIRRGAQLGEVRAHNWRAKDFSVFDGAGQAIARVTKRWAGLRELFTDADTYVVEVSPSAVDPLRSLAVATCLVIDVVMKQKDYAD